MALPRVADGAPNLGRPVFASDTLVLDILADRTGAVPEGPAVGEAVELLRRWRLAGLGYTWALRQGRANTAFAAALEPTYRQQQLGGAMLQESANRAVEALASANTPVLAFKGAGLVRSGHYADVGERPMDDVDLIVSPRHAGGAVHVLADAGFEPWGAWKPGREQWSDTFTFRDTAAPDGFACDLDLHWRTEYGSLRFGAGGSPLWLAPPSDSQTPAPEAHMLVVAEHFLKHLRVRPHLLAYADLRRLCLAVDAKGAAAWDSVVRLARGRWWTPAIGALLEVMERDLSAPVPERVVTELVAERPKVRRFQDRLSPVAQLAAHPEAESPPKRLGGIAERWQLGPGSTGVVRDFWGAAFPPAGWLKARYGPGSLAHLRLRHSGAVLRWAVGQGGSPLSPNQEAAKHLDSGPVRRAPDPVDTPNGRL